MGIDEVEFGALLPGITFPSPDNRDRCDRVLSLVPHEGRCLAAADRLDLARLATVATSKLLVSKIASRSRPRGAVRKMGDHDQLLGVLGILEHGAYGNTSRWVTRDVSL